MRSNWKGLFYSKHILDTIFLKKAGISITYYSRNSCIPKEFIGRTILVYNGIKHITVKVRVEMVGHKLGEFAATTKPVVHKVKIIKKK
jgi:ribosomal protein S19